MKEKQLLINLKSGSYQAFDQLYANYSDLLYGFVFKTIHSHEETKNIVQETFIKVWLHRGEINPDESFKAWLFKISKNRIIDGFRMRMKDPLFEDYMLHAQNENLSINPDDTCYDFELFKQQLEQAKASLSPRQRQVFQLCKEQDMTAAEVASMIHISEQAVYNYLSQAISILKKVLPSPHLFLFMLYFQYTN